MSMQAAEEVRESFRAGTHTRAGACVMVLLFVMIMRWAWSCMVYNRFHETQVS
jgi:hypothetical protein